MRYVHISRTKYYLWPWARLKSKDSVWFAFSLPTCMAYIILIGYLCVLQSIAFRHSLSVCHLGEYTFNPGGYILVLHWSSLRAKHVVGLAWASHNTAWTCWLERCPLCDGIIVSLFLLFSLSLYLWRLCVWCRLRGGSFSWGVMWSVYLYLRWNWPRLRSGQSSVAFSDRAMSDQVQFEWRREICVEPKGV